MSCCKVALCVPPIHIENLIKVLCKKDTHTKKNRVQGKAARLKFKKNAN